MRSLTRRDTLSASLAAAAAVALRRAGVQAQSASPEASAMAATPTLPELAGYPTLTATISDTGITLSASTVPAGIVRFVVTNTTAGGDGTSAVVLGPGAGKTMADMQAAAATPSPPDAFPPFLYDASILGGPADPPAGESREALLTIPAGDWQVFNDGEHGSVPLTAAASGDSVTQEPMATADVVFGDFNFKGLDGITAGQQLWKITNGGAQPHMLVLIGVPQGTTLDQVMATLMSEQSGTPVSSAVDPSTVRFLSDGVLLLSAGQPMWLPFMLAAGDYVALCFVTDPTTGQPHAAEGMVQLFTVS